MQPERGNSTGFDPYAGQYRDIINASVKASGESFEHFIALRVGLLCRRVQRRPPPGGVSAVLDFGCGTGSTELFLQRAFPQARLVGVDPSAESIRLARVAAPDAEFIATVATHLPLADQSFDLVYSNGTFHHIPPDQRAAHLAELFRVLRPGGYLFIYENNPYNPLTLRAMKVNPFDADACPIKLHELARLGAAAGFAALEGWYYFFFPRSLRLLRPVEPWLRWLPLGGQYGTWFRKAEAA